MSSRELLAKLPMGKVRLSLVASPITTAAWTVVTSSLPAPCTAISIAYTGDGILKLAKGAPGSEVELPLYVVPGMMMEKLIPLELAKALAISAKCLDQNTATGELVINLFG